MPINCDVTPVDLTNGRHKRRPIHIWTPVLIQNRGSFVDEKVNSLPDSHAIFTVLALNISIGRRGCGQSLQLETACNGELILSAGPLCITDHLKRIRQCRL